MAGCTKSPKCTKDYCGPRGLNGIGKFIRSPIFFTYYTLFFLVFVTMRLFTINYITGSTKSVICNSIFFVWTLLQFLASYVIFLITFFILRILIKLLTLMINWIKKITKIKKNQTIIQKIWNNIVRFFFICLIIVIFILFKYVFQAYMFILYWTFGIFMGYTIIGRKNECIAPPKKR